MRSFLRQNSRHNKVNILLRKKKSKLSKTKLNKQNYDSFKTSRIIKNDSRRSDSNFETIAKKIEQESALIRIGKNGISESIILEIRKLLSIKKAVKVKILQNAPIEDSKAFFDELESTVGYKIFRKKGNTAIFIYRKIE